MGYENCSILCKLYTVLLDSLAVPTTRKKTYGAKAPNKLCCKSTKAVLTSKYRIIINKQDYHPIRSFDIDAHKIPNCYDQIYNVMHNKLQSNIALKSYFSYVFVFQTDRHVRNQYRRLSNRRVCLFNLNFFS